MLNPPRRRSSRVDKRYSTATWRTARAEVRVRDLHACQECGRSEPAVRLVVDHRIPPDRYLGAFNDLSNLWLLCHGCNVSKGDLTVEEWHAALARRGAGQAEPVQRNPLVTRWQTVASDYTKPTKPRIR